MELMSNLCYLSDTVRWAGELKFGLLFFSYFDFISLLDINCWVEISEGSLIFMF